MKNFVYTNKRSCLGTLKSLFQIRMSIITVPLPRYKKAKYSCDHPLPVLNIAYTGSPPYGQYAKDCEKITLYYPHSLTIAPNQHITLRFPVLIETSLPCMSIIYGSCLVFRFGLTCSIATMWTNDSYLSVVVYNYKTYPLQFSKNSLTFSCLTVLATAN